MQLGTEVILILRLSIEHWFISDSQLEYSFV